MWSWVHIFKHSLFRLKITVGRRLCAYPSIHVQTLKITVGCRLCAYPSIHFSLDEDTLKITVGCLTSGYPSIHKNSQDHGRLPAVHRSKHSPFSWCWNSQDHGRLPDKHISKHSQQKLADMLDSLVHTGNTLAVGTSTRAVACAFTGGPQPRLFEFTSL